MHFLIVFLNAKRKMLMRSCALRGKKKVAAMQLRLFHNTQFVHNNWPSVISYFSLSSKNILSAVLLAMQQHCVRKKYLVCDFVEQLIKLSKSLWINWDNWKDVSGILQKFLKNFLDFNYLRNIENQKFWKNFWFLKFFFLHLKNSKKSI